MKRAMRPWLAAIVAIAALLVVLPSTAYAFGLLPGGDPLNDIEGHYAGWIGVAQGYAQTIYLALFIFELIAVAITTLLFRENLGEFFASIGFKVLLGGVFFWFIANGPNLAMQVIKFFTKAGETSFNGSDPTQIASGFILAAGGFFVAADSAHTVTNGELLALTAPPNCYWYYTLGYCPVATIAETAAQHETFILIAQGIGLMMIMGAIGILLQFYIVTIESYLVMSVGILMVGFAGSRWTFGFSQGYFSYMINVGVKLMVTYIILGVASVGLLPIVLGSAATATLASADIFGTGDAVAIGTAAITAVYVILVLGLLWTIPAFTAGILSGQSQSSGSAILSQAVGAFSGAAQALAQFGAANRSGADAASNREAMRDIQQAHTAGAGGATNAGALAQQAMSPGKNVDAQMGGSGGGATGGIGVNTPVGSTGSIYENSLANGAMPPFASVGGQRNGYSAPIPLNPAGGSPFGSGGGAQNSGRSLYDTAPGEIGKMNSGTFRERMQNTEWTLLSPDQQSEVMAYHRDDAEAVLQSRIQRDDESAAFNRAYGLGGLAQAAPRDIGQPTAVQVRTSNPDRV